MWVLVGLGNPGPEYAAQRHNVGFQIVDALAQHYGLTPFQHKGKAALAEGVIGGEKVLAVKPLTFMNLSGPPVASIVNFFKVPLSQVVVVHDDLNLIPGKVRFKVGGSTGGHNGLKSLEHVLGPNFSRLRIGIGHPGDRDDVTPYVLGAFSKNEQRWLSPLIDTIVENFPLILEEKADKFVSCVMQP